MAGVSCTDNTVAISMIRVSFHLCVHSTIIVMLLLLGRLHLRWMIVLIKTSRVARYDTDLLTIFV